MNTGSYRASTRSTIAAVVALCAIVILVGLTGCKSEPTETPVATVESGTPSAPAQWTAGTGTVGTTATASGSTGVPQESSVKEIAMADLVLEGKSAPVLYDEGIVAWKSGRLDHAEALLSRAADLRADHLKARINLARVRMDRSNPEGALEAADAALLVEPTSADALHQRGRALAALHRGDEAMEALRAALDSSPDHGYAANTLGLLLLQQGRAEEAVPLLESARDRLPDVAYVRNNLGVAYERVGRIDDAVAEYRACVSSGDSGGKAAASLARLNRPVETEVATVPESQ